MVLNWLEGVKGGGGVLAGPAAWGGGREFRLPIVVV